jgi:hypothetical protein
MAYIPNKLVLFGAIAAAALVVPATLGPLMFQDAEAAKDTRVVGGDQSTQAADQEGVVNAQVGVNANVQTGDICVQALASDSRCK